MKKILSILITLTVVFTLTACDYVEVDCSLDPDQDKCIDEPVTPTCEDTNTCEEAIMEITGIELVSENTVAGDLIEFKINTTGVLENGNPFDSRYVDVSMTFINDDTQFTVPAFWYQDFEYKFDENYSGSPKGVSGFASDDEDEPQGLESVMLTGDAHFRVRANLPETGNWNYVVNLKHEGQILETKTGIIPVNYESQNYKGIISLSDTGYFLQGDETFIPVGQNNAWYTSSTRKTVDYKVWFEEMNNVGMNASRIWMATWGFALEWGNDGLHDYTNRQNQAYRLDKVVEYADEYDIFFLLTILNHGQFSATTNAEWADNPWNDENGGMLSHPAQFFTNDEAKVIFKDQLRYIIARWGYSDNILAWELFNEVDWIDNFSQFAGKSWHTEMGNYIKEIDPFNHLVTTSVKGQNAYMFKTDALDFVNAHDYGYEYKNINTNLPFNQINLQKEAEKPVWFSEIGVNWENGNKTQNSDATGVALSQQSWAGMLGGGLGGAMNWWWDSYTDPYDHYDMFKGAATYAKEMDLTSSVAYLAEMSGVETNNTNIDVIGIKTDDNVYGYIFNKDYSHLDPTPVKLNDITLTLPLTTGDYTMTVYNTITGDIISTKTITSTNDTVTIEYGSITTDSAFIIE